MLSRKDMLHRSKIRVTASEIVGLRLAVALVLSFPYARTQVGLGATLIVIALVAHLAVVDRRPFRGCESAVSWGQHSNDAAIDTRGIRRDSPHHHT
jgi:hypothetical protein